jgi:hypothetical protein
MKDRSLVIKRHSVLEKLVLRIIFMRHKEKLLKIPKLLFFNFVSIDIYIKLANEIISAKC